MVRDRRFIEIEFIESNKMNRLLACQVSGSILCLHKNSRRERLAISMHGEVRSRKQLETPGQLSLGRGF